jgi:hypothetical protein
MFGTLFSTPRPEPGHFAPALGGSIVLLIALPVFLVAGWPVEGWGLAAVLWVGVHVIDVFLARTRSRTDTLGAPMQAFGLFFKLIAILVVLFAAVAAKPHVAVAAVLTYALAYTFELGLSLVGYFGATKQ